MFRTVLALSAASAVFAAPTVESSLEARVLSCGSARWSMLSAAQWVKNANPGWNLGNTLDGIPTEGSWGPAAKPADFDAVKANGFKSVRIPVTWTDHYVTGAPTWTVNSTWLQRVSDVIDEVTSRGLYALVNVHHDSWNEFDLTSTSNYTTMEAQFYALWKQIGTKLGCKSSMLAFEPLNEPTGTTQAQFDELNKLNGIFLQAISDAGGFNAKRVVTLVGPGEDGVKTAINFKKPTGFPNLNYAIQFHYYSPYDFIFSAWGKTIWGSDADKAALDADFAAVRGNFSNVPIIIGEWESNNVDERTAHWKYFDSLIRTANKYGFSTILWDNTASELDRTTEKFRDQVAINILMNAVKGQPQALPDSTEDGSTSQFSYAYIYHRANTAVTDQVLTYNFSGTTLTSIVGPSGTALVKGIDYTVAANAITYKASLLGKYLSASAPAGSLANFTLNFSKGAALTANLVKWDVSTLGSKTASAASVSSGTDLSIPITWKGINKLAAVEATLPDGTCLFDTWTVYLPALQQCRMTDSGQWDYDDGHVILKSATVAAVVAAAAKPVTFTFEFYPRQPGNNATYTLTA